ncbi:hypothetical protein [Roseibium sp.]|uniref:hypothetical protein n=1 Tax=Roseibium sp. TaxID=1936156 RepID=UPI003B52A99C
MQLDHEQVQAINEVADDLGISPNDLATAIAYETIGTMSPDIMGGMNRDGTGKGTFKGLIQFSPRNQSYFGVKPGMSFVEQLKGPVKEYLQHTGVRPGMGLKDIYSAILTGRVGQYSKKDRNGSVLQHVGRMTDRYGSKVADALARGATISPELAAVMERDKHNSYVSLPVDTSWEALGSMPSMPGIDGLAVADRGGVPSPSAKRDNLSNPSFSDNAVGPLAERMGSYDAPVSTVAELMGALGAPTSQNQQGFQATATATQGFSPSHQASVTADVSNAFGPTSATGVAGVPSSRFDQAFSAFDNGVPTGRFDQAFNAFGTPNQSTAATTTGLPALDAPQTIASRPEAIGYQAPEALTSQQEEKSKDKEKDFDWFDKSNARGAVIGALTGGLPGMVVGGLAPTAVRGAQALMGNGFGGLGGLGGFFDGSPSANTQALGYARDMTMGNPFATQQDFLTNYMGAMRGFTGNPNIDPFGGLPRDGRVAAYNAALRDQGLAIGLMEGLSRDLGGAFGSSVGNSGSGGGRGGSRGGGGRGGMGGRESGSYGADG